MPTSPVFIGMDGEFIGVKDGRLVTAAGYVNATKRFGVDGHPRTFELRTIPKKDSHEMVDDIHFVLNCGMTYAPRVAALDEWNANGSPFSVPL